MTIIFDLNGTLFDPAAKGLVPGALEVLSMLKPKAALHLVSRLEPGRSERLRDLGIEDYFESAHFVEDKEESIRTLIGSSTEEVYVVGDYLHQEILYGNRYGAKTVWLKRGHLAHMVPESSEGEPWRTISELPELLEIVP